MNYALLTVDIRQEQDVVLVRQRARQVAGLLGFREQEQTRVATAVSEIARNAFRYAGRGQAEFRIEEAPPALVVRIKDKGPGIADLQAVLEGRYVSKTGMGLGLLGARRLMDRCDVVSVPGEGTLVTLAKALPSFTLVTPEALGRVSDALVKQVVQRPIDVVEEQNRELLEAMSELERREAELARLNSELQETNSGVVALSRELEDKAEALSRASELKSRFLSNVSHEFRTPLNSIMGLSRLLLEKVDGELSTEQERQVSFILKSAEALSELINDMLDLAKIEAGKTDVRPKVFEMEDLFATLRGMLRPLISADTVALVFDSPQGLPQLYTDEGKLAQILRNFISNALKFTERGEVRVRAWRGPGGRVSISVADTGIGIAPEHHERIFEEFSQVEGPLQRKVKGTGLGLPLSRKLAQLLGGDLSLESTVGRGATFTVTVPGVFAPGEDVPPEVARAWLPEPEHRPVLVVEDDADTLALYREHLAEAGMEVVAARTLAEARAALANVRPLAVVLDVMLGEEVGWDLLSEVKRDPRTRDLPVLVVSSTDQENQAVALGADDYCAKPMDREWLLQSLQRFAGEGGKTLQKVLIIDDDEVARYLLRRTLSETPYVVLEASSGREGLARARTDRPDVIFLDMSMPEMSGMEVLAALKGDASTATIPVIIHTSRPLPPEEVDKLSAQSVGMLPKDPVSRERAVARVREALAKAGVAPRRDETRG